MMNFYQERVLQQPVFIGGLTNNITKMARDQ